MQISSAPKFGLCLRKLASHSHRLMMLSLLLSASAQVVAVRDRAQREQHCQETHARLAARNAALDALGRDIAGTNAEMHRLIKAGKWTAKDDKRLSAVLRTYEIRLTELKRQARAQP